MELILTDAEKKSATWLELDNESIGKLVKASALKIREHDTQYDILACYSASIILCSMAADANADTFSTEIDNLTIRGESFGKWQITIKKLSE